MAHAGAGRGESAIRDLTRDDLLIPAGWLDAASFETTRPGVYLAGTVCGGYQTGRWFIENGRHHARLIAGHIARGRSEGIAFDRIHWKTSE